MGLSHTRDDGDDVVILQPGHHLGRYELLAEVARGGMASVWVARIRGAHGFEKLVAIKTVLPQHASDSDFKTMLIDESRIASSIDHPNVAQIADFGSEGGVLHVVMEWVDGDSLQKIHNLLRKRDIELPAQYAVRLVADASAGLHAAHELRGENGQSLEVVHRDVSPQNLLLTSRGVVKVIDFGVAKAQGRLAGNTTTGFIRGKVRYMPPEQALGKPVDRRADVWALGAVLRVLLTGASPYEGPTEMVVLDRIARGEPPTPLPPEIPLPIARVLDRALSPEASRRYPTAAAFRAALEDGLTQLGLKATPEDVARFLDAELPELANGRRKLIAAAREATRVRSGASSSPSIEAGVPSSTMNIIDTTGPTAVGETVVSQTAPLVDAPTRALATPTSPQQFPAMPAPQEDSYESLRNAAVAREQPLTVRTRRASSGLVVAAIAMLIVSFLVLGTVFRMKKGDDAKSAAASTTATPIAMPPIDTATVSTPAAQPLVEVDAGAPQQHAAKTGAAPKRATVAPPPAKSAPKPKPGAAPTTTTTERNNPTTGPKDPSKEDFGF